MDSPVKTQFSHLNVNEKRHKVSTHSNQS